MLRSIRVRAPEVDDLDLAVPTSGPLPAAHHAALVALVARASGADVDPIDLDVELRFAPQPPAPWVPPWLLQLVGARTRWERGATVSTQLVLDRGVLPPLSSADDDVAAEILAGVGVKGGPHSAPCVLDDRGFLVPALRVEKNGQTKLFALVSLPGVLRAAHDDLAAAAPGDVLLLSAPPAEAPPEGVQVLWPAR